MSSFLMRMEVVELMDRVLVDGVLVAVDVMLVVVDVALEGAEGVLTLRT